MFAQSIDIGFFPEVCCDPYELLFKDERVAGRVEEFLTGGLPGNGERERAFD